MTTPGFSSALPHAPLREAALWGGAALLALSAHLLVVSSVYRFGVSTPKPAAVQPALEVELATLEMSAAHAVPSGVFVQEQPAVTITSGAETEMAELSAADSALAENSGAAEVATGKPLQPVKTAETLVPPPDPAQPVTPGTPAALTTAEAAVPARAAKAEPPLRFSERVDPEPAEAAPVEPPPALTGNAPAENPADYATDQVPSESVTAGVTTAELAEPAPPAAAENPARPVRRESMVAQPERAVFEELPAKVQDEAVAAQSETVLAERPSDSAEPAASSVVAEENVEGDTISAKEPLVAARVPKPRPVPPQIAKRTPSSRVRESAQGQTTPRPVARETRPRAERRLADRAEQARPARRTQRAQAKRFTENAPPRRSAEQAKSTRRAERRQPGRARRNEQAHAEHPRGAARGNAARQSPDSSSPSTAPTVSPADWQAKVFARLNRFKRYPSGSRARGVVTVSFRVTGSGAVSGVHVARSSGSPELDRAALAMVTRASPVPAPPSRSATSVTVPVRFSP